MSPGLKTGPGQKQDKAFTQNTHEARLPTCSTQRTWNQQWKKRPEASRTTSAINHDRVIVPRGANHGT
jgi:hypothetical protein